MRLRNISSAAIVPASLRSIQEYEIQCKTVKQLENLGGIIASKSIKGDVYLLTGSVGVGKTCFARGFVRRLAGDKLLSVTSPTFLLDNTYEIVNKDYMYVWDYIAILASDPYWYDTSFMLQECTIWTCTGYRTWRMYPF